MPVPLIVAGVGAGVAAIGTGLRANAQKKAIAVAAKSAKKKAKNATAEANAALKFKEDNPYVVPKTVAENVALAKNELNNSNYLSNVERQADATLAGQVGALERASTSGADLLAAVNKVSQQSAETKMTGAVNEAQLRQGRVANVIGTNSEASDYESMAYDQNINMPYLQRMELAQGKLGIAGQMQANAAKLGMENAGAGWGVMTSLGNSATSMAGAGMFDKKPV